MIITRLRGGLGNQMFQYAAGKAAAKKRGTDLKFDMRWFDSPGAKNPSREYALDIFGIAAPRASMLNLIRSELVGKIIREGDAKPDLREASGKSIYLDGFWQSESFFKDIESDLRNDFNISAPLLPASTGLSAQMQGPASVCVNVRRTDYLTSSQGLGFVGIDYYKKAVELVLKTTPEARFFVFSDEIEWCRENLGFIPRPEFVSHEHAGPKFSNYLRLMSLCESFIIPNSTFAWWAVWLQGDPSAIVIAPKQWFKEDERRSQDIIRKSWTTIDRS